MKIYLPNVPLSNIEKNMDKLSQLELNRTINDIIEINSLDYGVHIIEKKNIYRVEPDFNPKYEVIKDFKGYDLLLDKSIPKYIPVISQMPTKYFMTKIKLYEYKTNKNSPLKLVVKCIKTVTEINISNNNTNHGEKPIDFYFEYDSLNIDITDRFFQDELNMFLSHVN